MAVGGQPGWFWNEIKHERLWGHLLQIVCGGWLHSFFTNYSIYLYTKYEKHWNFPYSMLQCNQWAILEGLRLAQIVCVQFHNRRVLE